jgi:hypothetical protein
MGFSGDAGVEATYHEQLTDQCVPSRVLPVSASAFWVAGACSRGFDGTPVASDC